MNNLMLKSFLSVNTSKVRNLKLIYQLILRNSSATSDMIMDKTNIKPATCARLLDELAQHLLVLTDEFGESTGGRKPILYRVNPSIAYIIGVEITGIFSTILLMDIELSIIDKIKLKTDNIAVNQTLLNHITIHIEKLLQNNKLTIDQILGIGLSGDDLLASTHLTSEQIDQQIDFIKTYIYNRLPAYITLGSGTNFAAIAEHKLHYATTSRRFLFTRCDIEIHSSTILDDAIPITQTGMTHTFGHTTIDINGKACSCGSFGCLHQYSALPAIKEKIIDQIERGRPSVIQAWVSSTDEIDYHLIFRALEMSDRLCVDILEEAAYYYSIALFNYILAFQPDTVICGGTLVPKSSFFQVIKNNIERKIKHYPQLRTQIYPAVDSYDIVSQGAGAMVLAHYLK